jgi:hypothetical protein
MPKGSVGETHDKGTKDEREHNRSYVIGLQAIMDLPYPVWFF